MNQQLFAVVFGINGFGFPKLDGVKLAGKWHQCFRQALPNQNNKVLRGWLHSFGNKIHIQVEVAVIEVIDHVYLDEVAEFFDINDKTCDGIGAAFHCYMEVVVVPVPVLVGTLAKHGTVLFFRPFLHPKFMSGVKSFDSGDVNH